MHHPPPSHNTASPGSGRGRGNLQTLGAVGNINPFLSFSLGGCGMINEWPFCWAEDVIHHVERWENFSIFTYNLEAEKNKCLPNFHSILICNMYSFSLWYHNFLAFKHTCHLTSALHAFWFKWDRLCGTISRFQVFMWDIWYQFCQMGGTALGGAWWSRLENSQKIVRWLFCIVDEPRIAQICLKYVGQIWDIWYRNWRKFSGTLISKFSRCPTLKKLRVAYLEKRVDVTFSTIKKGGTSGGMKAVMGRLLLHT